MADTTNKNNDRRGLASADAKTRARVAKLGGEAYHSRRGAKGSDGRRSSVE